MPVDDKVANPTSGGQKDEQSQVDPNITDSLARQMSQMVRALETAAGPMREFLAALQEPWTTAMNQFRAELGKLDWDAVEKRTDAGVLRLAEVGWTVPDWLTPRQVVELSEADPAAVDAWFTELFLGAENGLARVQARLESSPRLAEWRPLVFQTCAAVRRGEHLLAVPSLLLMIEGFIAQLVDPTRLSQVRDTDVVRLLRQVKLPDGLHTTDAIWASTHAFVARLFAHTDFASDTPAFLNRHWILHGRRGADWSVADALRLLNALSTLEWLMRFTEDFD